MIIIFLIPMFLYSVYFCDSSIKLFYALIVYILSYLYIYFKLLNYKKITKNKFVVVTGGAGFVGSNLIEALLKIKNIKIISIDNYSSGLLKTTSTIQEVKYLKGNTKDIYKILKKYNKSISTIFHFGEFLRIYQSFIKFDQCFESNTIGSNAVFKFCLDNKIKQFIQQHQLV